MLKDKSSISLSKFVSASGNRNGSDYIYRLATPNQNQRKHVCFSIFWGSRCIETPCFLSVNELLNRTTFVEMSPSTELILTPLLVLSHETIGILHLGS